MLRKARVAPVAVTMAAVALLAVLALRDTPARSQTHGTAFQLTESQQPQPDTVIAFGAGDALTAVYADGTPGSRDVFARTSVDNGRNWSDAVNISDDAADSFSVTATTERGTHYVAWASLSQSAYSVQFSKSTDGVTWSTPAPISGSRGGVSPRLVAVKDTQSDETIVTVLWRSKLQDSVFGGAVVAQSLDSGTNWQPPVVLQSSSVLNVRLASAHQRLIALNWTPFGVGIDSFDAIGLANPVHTSFDIFSFFGDLNTNGNGDTFVTGYGSLNGVNGIKTSFSGDGGLTWTPLSPFYSLVDDIFGEFSSTLSNDHLYVSWNQTSAVVVSPSAVKFRSMSLGSGQLSDVLSLSDADTEAFSSSVALNGGVPYVVWSQFSLNLPAAARGCICPLESGALAREFGLPPDNEGKQRYQMQLHAPTPVGAAALLAASRPQSGNEPQRAPYLYLTYIGIDTGTNDAQLFFSLGYISGDADCSAHVTTADILALLRDEAGLPTDAKCLPATDVDCDGDRTISDLRLTLAYLGGVPHELPNSCSPIDA